MNAGRSFIVEVSSASSSWRTVHILMSVITAVTSLATFIPFSLALKKFSGVCPLNAQVGVIPGKTNYSFQFDLSDYTQHYWGSENTCNYCLFTSVSSFIYSFIWLWFFTVCSADNTKSMSSLSRPWMVLPPAIVFHFVMIVLVFVASGLLTSGVNTFCSYLDGSIVKGCSNAQEAKWKDFQLNNFYAFLVACQVTMWISSFSWLFAFLLLLVRCCAGSDFKVLKVSTSYDESLEDRPGPSGV